MKLAEEAVSRILVHYGRHWAPRRGDPFKSLVRTILSQNTNYRNEDAAYTRLEEMVGVTPSTLSEASLEKIADAIRPAGMYNQRSLTLKKVADAVLREYGGDLIPVLKKPYEEAREELRVVLAKVDWLLSTIADEGRRALVEGYRRKIQASADGL